MKGVKALTEFKEQLLLCQKMLKDKFIQTKKLFKIYSTMIFTQLFVPW